MNEQLTRPVRIPALIHAQPYNSLQTETVTAVDGQPLADLTLTPLIKTHDVLRRAPERFHWMQSQPARRILDRLKEAANLLRGSQWSFGSLSKARYCSLVSQATGLPLPGVAREVEEIADLLDHLEEIVRVQLPGPVESCLDRHEYDAAGLRVGYYPAGKSLLVVVPGNIPTICLYWLIPLAQKRTIILIPPAEDPFTHWMLGEAIGFVDPELSSCIQFLPCSQGVWSSLLGQVDQIILPESLRRTVSRSASLLAKTSFIHYGRTKLLVAGEWDSAAVDVAFRRMTWNFGRTCTGLTSVVVKRDAEGFCEALAGKIQSEFAADFPGCLGRLPLFRLEVAEKIDELIEALTQNGEAEDVTRRVAGVPRLLKDGRRAMLRPTVLQARRKNSKAFGLELPFPFVSVAETADEGEMIALARNSLILSVIGGGSELLRRLCFEPSILKVFAGAQVERGYHYLDPHEGYMADFLNQKKAVSVL